MTSQQFYSPEGQKLTALEYKKTRLLDKNGYTKGVAKISERIEKQKAIIEKLYPSQKN